MSAQDPEEGRDPEILSGGLAELSLRAYFDGYRPKPTEFPQPISLAWGDLNAQITTGKVELRGSALVLRIASEDPNVPFNPFDRDHVRNVPATIELAGGTLVQTPFASLCGWGIGGDVEGKPYWSELAMPVWEWLPTDAGVHVFQGDAPGLKVDLSDNLSLRDSGKLSHGHFRGRGTFPWHLIHTKAGPVALVEASCLPGLHRDLRSDLSALQFAMGTGIDLQVLWIVEPGGGVIGGVGLGRGAQSTHKQRRPVPDGPAEEHCWTAPLFRLVASKASADDRHITTALAGYRDTLRGHIHGGYLLGQVALEAFCKAVGPKKKLRPVVTSVEDWQSWVIAHQEEIAKQCPDDTSSRVLLKRLLNSVTQPPSGEVVQVAFREWGIELPKVLTDELGRRAPAAHKFVMFDEDDGDIQDAADRVNMVQCLLAAAVAKDVGYTGAIVGWERDRSGSLLPPAFWDSEPLSEAIEWFACWRSRDGAEPWSPGKAED